LQELPLPDSGGAIHSQKLDSRAADRGKAEDLSAADLKMVVPEINGSTRELNKGVS